MKFKIFSRRFEKEAGRVKHIPVTEKFEHCVMCGELTAVPVSMPIDLRENYVVGCGQLCNSCRLKLREETEKGWPLSNAQVLQAVEQSRSDNKNDC